MLFFDMVKYVFGLNVICTDFDKIYGVIYRVANWKKKDLQKREVKIIAEILFV